MNKFLLVSILLIAAILRLYKLDARPLGFTWDEAALGYNAYSLLKTGKDEFGITTPIVFKSFGDYKPGLYIYLSVPAIHFFGLNEFSTRLPSAISGILLVLIVYLLTWTLFGRKHAIYPAFLMAIMPWAIHFSRGAWESNVNLTITSLAVLLFVRKKYLSSAAFFGLTLWIYQGAKMFTPLILLSLILIYFQRIKIQKLLIPTLLLLLISLPVILGLSTQSGRLKVFSVFSYSRQESTINNLLQQDNLITPNNILFQLFHSEFYDQTRGIVQRYLNHFSSRYLLFEGDWSNLRQSTPFFGYIYLPEVLTILLGLRFLFKSNSPGSKLIMLWILLAPIPSALSRDIVSAVRSVPMILPLVVISGLGLSQISRSKPFFILFTFILGLFTIYYLDLYFIHSPQYTADSWLYPYKPALKVVSENINKYKNIVFTSKLGQPYIFTLFYLKMDPKVLQDNNYFTASSVGDVGYVPQMGKFSFRPIYWPNDRGASSTLFIGDQYELPEQDLQTTNNLIRVSEVKYPNGSPGMTIVGLP